MLTSIMGINVFWLFPLAVFTGNGIISGAAGVVIAYFPLILIAVIFNAGGARKQVFRLLSMSHFGAF
jgi:Fuc2NAc and GlcNAc transferase